MFMTRKPDDEWFERLRQRGFTSDTTFPDAGLEALKRKLMVYGGYGVVLAHPEPHLREIMTRGAITSGSGASMEEGNRSACHQNAFELWLEDPQHTKLFTGWALSDDGLWRQHSWAKRGSTIVETTTPRVAYFGFELTQEEAASFGSIA